MFANHPANRAAELVGAGYTLIDVRERSELLSGALPDSVNIPLAQLPTRIKSYPTTTKLAVICQSGGRSMQAAASLIAMGYGEVVNLYGGVNAAMSRSGAA